MQVLIHFQSICSVDEIIAFLNIKLLYVICLKLCSRFTIRTKYVKYLAENINIIWQMKSNTSNKSFNTHGYKILKDLKASSVMQSA